MYKRVTGDNGQIEHDCHQREADERPAESAGSCDADRNATDKTYEEGQVECDFIEDVLL